MAVAGDELEALNENITDVCSVLLQLRFYELGVEHGLLYVRDFHQVHIRARHLPKHISWLEVQSEPLSCARIRLQSRLGRASRVIAFEYDISDIFEAKLTP